MANVARSSLFPPLTRRALFAPVALFVVGCSGQTAEIGGFESPPSGSAPGNGTGSEPGASNNANPGSVKPGPDNGTIGINVRATAAPFAHKDGLAGLTPEDSRVGIVSLTLLRSPQDPKPWVVFDKTVSYVEASLNDGADTEVARIDAATVVEDTFSMARVGVTHVRYRVPSTMHVAAPGGVVAGAFDNVQALAEGATIDGSSRQAGWYRYAFEAAGYKVPLEGTNAPLPQVPTTGPFTLVTEQGKAFYTFPVVLKASRTAAKVTLSVNVHQQFRWQDQPTAGYASGVFDSTPSSYEPVRKFGANSFEILVQ